MMTETYYRTGNYKLDHSTFGGLIYKGDFDHCQSMSDIASRIISDWKFDYRMRKNEENRDKDKNNKKK